MKTKKINTTNNSVKRLTIWAIVVSAILMIPLLAKAPWTMLDFIFAGIVLYGCGAIYELTTRNRRNNMHRMAIGFAVTVILLLIWAWAVA